VLLEVEDPVRIDTEVPENESVCVECGTPVQVGFTSLQKEKLFVGKVTRESHALSATARTMRVEVDIANADLHLRPGMMASIELAVEVHKNVLAVPAACVLTERQNNSVFALESGKAKKIYVEAGVQDHLWIEIRGQELPEGTTLIQEVRNGISDGMLVSAHEK
jgi:multidrug efflux pump subunit AcrA (membrane-fusion protein)